MVQQTYDVGTEERRFAETLYPMVQDSFGMESTRRTGAVRCAPASTVAIGASASVSSADESRSDGVHYGWPCPLDLP